MIRAINHIVLSLYREERALLWMGVLGLALASLCFSAMLVQGRIVEPEGDLFKAGTFDFAIGIYTLTVALLASVAGFTRLGRRLWRWSLIGVFAYAYAIETVQVFRGIDPRFSRHGTPLDEALGGIFFLVAQGIIANFLVLSWKFFRRVSPTTDKHLVLAVRYASAATLMAFAAGYAMSAGQGAEIGEAGNLLPLHAAGFHGLQAVPLVALFIGRSDRSDRQKRLRVHLAGLAWLGLCAAIAWQTAAGRPVLELSLAPLVAILLLVGWTVVAARSAVPGAWRLKEELLELNRVRA